MSGGKVFILPGDFALQSAALPGQEPQQQPTAQQEPQQHPRHRAMPRLFCRCGEALGREDL